MVLRGFLHIIQKYNGYYRHNFYQNYNTEIKWYINGDKYKLEKSFELRRVKSHSVWELLGSV